MITWILFFLISADPYPTVAMINEFQSKQDCEEFVESLDLSKAKAAHLTCQGMLMEDAPKFYKEGKETPLDMNNI